MSNVAWNDERQQFAARVQHRSVSQAELVTDRAGHVVLAKATFEASANEFKGSPYLMISHVVDGGGSFYRQSELGKINGIMRRGSTAVSLPGSQAEGRNPGAQLLGLAVSSVRVEKELADICGLDSLHAASSQLLNDSLIASVLTTVWTDCQYHGASTAFFDHALGLILQRLTRQPAPMPRTRSVTPLPKRQLSLVLDLIEARLGDDLSVSDLACEIDRDVHSFTRAFRASTGKAPFEYLTYKRMEKAKELLAGPKNITEIAGELSYSNPAKFASAFKRHTNFSPSTWRKCF